MVNLNCPGCGTELDPPTAGDVSHCVICGGEYTGITLSLAELFVLLSESEDGPAKDFYAGRLSELGAEQVIAELGG